MMNSREMNKCKWTGQAKCHLFEQVRTTAFGHKVEPFECCDDKVAMQKMHCTCQPTTMGFMSYEEYMKAKINDKSKLNFYLKQNEKIRGTDISERKDNL